MSIHALINNFNAGEFSPLLEGRTDIAKHRSGCRKLENFIPRIFGGAHSRPGMVYRGRAKSQSTQDKTRLIEFEFSESTRLVLEFGNQYVRFWKEGGLIHHSGNAATWALVSDWQTANVYNLNDIRANGGNVYKCTSGHTSGASTEPGVGASWQTVWSLQPKSFLKGDYAKRSNVLFYCIADHAATSNTEPQAGNNWQTYWSQTTIYERPSPFSTAQLFDIQFNQLNDWVYLVHPDVPPQKLSRIADDQWTLLPVDFTFPPLGDENVTDTTMSLSHTSGNGRTLTSSSNIFESGHVGAHFGISHRRETSFIELPLRLSGVEGWTASSSKNYAVNDRVHWKDKYYTCKAAHASGSTTEPAAGASWTSNWDVYAGSLEYTSSSLRLVGEWSAFSYENWAGTLHIERSTDEGATWETIRSFSGNNDRNINPTGNQDVEALFRLRFVDSIIDDTTTPDGRAVLEAVDSKVGGLVRITAVASPTSATCDIIKSPASTSPTTLWREGAWSNKRGYPRTVTFHEQRLIYGGSKADPRRVWFSVVGDVDNFRFGTLDDNAFNYLLSGKSNAIQWLAPIQGIAVGTLGDELVISAASQNDTLTPTTPNAPKQSSRGSAYLPAIQADDVVLFVQSDRRTMREFVFDFAKGGFVSQTMNLLSEHVTSGGIVQMALQQKPETVIWVVTGNGDLVGMTYERNQEVVAWHRHPTDGFVESVCVISGIPPGADEIWLCVRREIDGQPARYLERMDPEHWNKVESGNKDYFICVDSAKAQDFGADVQTVTGLEHLEGRLVSVLVDGAVHPKRIVENGEIELQAPGRIVVVGIPFEPLIEPNEMEVSMPDGTSRGRKLRIDRAVILFWQSLGCQVRQNGLDWEDLYFRDTQTNMDESEPVFSGQKEIHLEGRHEMSMSLQIRQTAPLPLNILAVTAKLNVYGD